MLQTQLRGARIHNLKGIDLDVSPGEIIVITGPSGAGKSSLALDTLYAEGQRRFVESFSPYARQFLERLPRPPMDRLDPVAAGIAVDQKAPVRSSRSTVATLADILPYLAGLFSEASVPTCPEHGLAGTTMHPGMVAGALLAKAPDRPLLLTIRRSVLDKEAHLVLMEELLRDGYRRVLVAGAVQQLDQLKPSVAVKAGAVEVILDRVTARQADAGRIGEAAEAAFRRGAVLRVHDAETFALVAEYRSGLSCPTCGFALSEPRPGYFSYDSPLGACEACRGFGRTLGIDWAKVIPNEGLSLSEGAIRPWRGESATWERHQLEVFAEARGIPLDVPWADLPDAQKTLLLDGAKKSKTHERFYGVKEWFAWLETKTYKMHVRVLLSRYRAYEVCVACQGARLNPRALQFRLGGSSMADYCRMEIGEALARMKALPALPPQGEVLRKELMSRLTYLTRVGLSYLALDRQGRTLSGGESQRVTLTAALGTSLHQALFVLDEPTVGLHPGEVRELCVLLRELADRDNAVIIVEHDPILLEIADRVVQLGPEAGPQGGEIVFDGAPKKLPQKTRALLVGQELSRRARELDPGRVLQVSGVAAHNLKNVTLEVPLGVLTVVAGPSGSGKSSLVVDVLYRALLRHLGQFDEELPGAFQALAVPAEITSVELLDQTPLGRTSRGNPATYTKAWDAVRKAFAAEPQAIAQGLTASHFSFNVAGGRCESCNGEGAETVEMQFLADVTLPCPECGGKRFLPSVLAVTHRGLHVAETLELTVDQAIEHFSALPAVRRALLPLALLGLGYVRLGQPLSTLSGGEAQRLKLSRVLTEAAPGRLYLLDEPSAGLHAAEVQRLMNAISTLLEAGGTVVVVDHDLSVIAAADHVVELGPGGGEAGGQVVFTGSVQKLREANTATARALSAPAAEFGTKRSSKTRPVTSRSISVRGAREHSLKDVSVDIPHGALTVVTGPSGSGKSSLAFDVVFAEGQRRFLETLTPYARRFLPTLPRPNVDVMDGIVPSIALEQRTTRLGARSTVATVTEIAQYLRLLFARLATIRCPDHGVPVTRRSADELVFEVRQATGTGALLAPVVRARKGTYAEVFESAQRAGMDWAVADGQRVQTARPPRLAKTKVHNIELVVADSARFSDLSEETVRKALAWGQGSLVLSAGNSARTYSLGGSCETCGYSIQEVDPRHFSFNTTQGQCAACAGTGFIDETTCSECGGTRLGPIGRTATIAGRTYPALMQASIGALGGELDEMGKELGGSPVFAPIVSELRRRLSFLLDVGLDYLELGRDASTLSGGELQRLRLAAQLGAGLTGALYVLDEPTIGLHPRDTGRLLLNLRKLVELGSTVLMVEHDEDAVRAADHLIDLGPEGGRRGGNVVCSGTPASVLSNPESPTARAIQGGIRLRVAKPLGGSEIALEGATLHNLRGDRFAVPVGRLSVVAGVSGSGKSSLVRGVFLPAAQKALGLAGAEPGPHKRITGIQAIKRAIQVDQSPIGRTSRSTPATFLGVFDEIRALFARSPEAMMQGFTKARFSFNTPGGGRCATCDGQGVLSHEMSFLPDVITECPACFGLRFEERTQAVRYLGRSIGDVLRLTAEEAVDVFAAHPRICAPLRVLCDLGAGYIQLGQGSHTLSGGEAQRLKLSAELAAGARHEPTLYVLDEPTTGLHLGDVERLIVVLDRLVERGDTVVVIEHHPAILASADCLMDLGPEAGPRGGQILFQGPVDKARRSKSPTGRVLDDYLKATSRSVSR